ncbi:MAG: replicative DNA helicase [Myxococcaceae bacterium]|nr:replicative DNA helicase [Myxococcaceae bacterium]
MTPNPSALTDLSAESAVLGAIVADNSLLAEVLRAVDPEDFSHAGHGQIFAAMRELDRRSQKVDPLTLAEELKSQGQLQSAGGPAYLAQLDQSTPFSQNALEYAAIVKDRAVRRALAAVGRQVSEMASSDAGRTEELVDEAERRIFLIAEKKRVGDLEKLSNLMMPALDQLDRMRQSATGITGLSTGYVDLDAQLTGLHGGELIVLAARPGIGKTSLAMNMALHAARNEKRAVAVFSLEMPSTQLTQRLLASAARIDMRKLRNGRLSENDMGKLSEAANELFTTPLYVDDSGALSSFDLRAKARRLKQRDDSLGLIVIDYLQLMHQKGQVESRQLEVAEISRALKQLAKELNVPIIALSQLNRKVEERKGGKPMLSDLRESGAIEQDADVVMFIHREDDGEEQAGPPSSAIPVELIVAKQRNGPVGSVDLIFLSEFTRFESRARGEYQ